MGHLGMPLTCTLPVGRGSRVGGTVGVVDGVVVVVVGIGVVVARCIWKEGLRTLKFSIILET